MTQFKFPPLPLAEWQATRDTITEYSKVLGKIRRAMTPKQKHWWHVSLRVISLGVTTTAIPVGDKTLELVMDFTAHRLLILTSVGERLEIPLQGQSVAAFCTEVMDGLESLGISVEIDRSQFDEAEGAYDETAVTQFWQAFSQIDMLLKQFKHSFREESSPVQLWPHHFDIAVVWFSGRLVPDQDPDDEESADEHMNFGFSTGDEGISEPYFFATAYPTPDELISQPLPAPAYWQTEGYTGAILPYQALVDANKPNELLLDYLQAAHKAGSQFMRK